MTVHKLQIIPTDLFSTYLEQVPKSLQKAFDALQDAEISTDTFSFYTSVSSVYSSKIEGEDIELDSYIKHKKFGIEFLPDYTKKIDDLYNAYTFAKSNEINEKNIAEAHKLLSKHIVAKNRQGKLRTQNMYVSTPDGRIEYVAASPFEVETEMKKFYADLSILLKTEMNIEEVFFYASLIHLVFVKIHPWNDGNGRSARLYEKWFLAQKLGEKAWFVQSEKMYYNRHQTYYSNIRLLGLEYPELDYNQALPFLLMLPNAVVNE
ncbi:MAG TPA: Fic family protein [Chitinophagales bacterium]|jgi:Fic family protein|nr:Fic family protein [Chitinophagales bacterium]HQV79113.1 Fic family protein [Chitinophagales bacterium]HQW79763.1 Fic family protein [Chitinophagales bacterium]HRB67134.1 Fic family protein [Chitinophagales bacterium]